MTDITVSRELLEQTLSCVVTSTEYSIGNPAFEQCECELRAALVQPQQAFTIEDLKDEYHRGVDDGHHMGLSKAREAIAYKEAYYQLIAQVAKFEAIKPQPVMFVMPTVEQSKAEQQERTCGTCKYDSTCDATTNCINNDHWEPKE